MKGVLIDETTLDARAVDYDPEDLHATLDPVSPQMSCMGTTVRSVAGRNYRIFHDDEFLYHRCNVTGICAGFPELLMGSLLIVAEKEDPEDEEDCGLRDMTAEEQEQVIAAWRPVSPEEAQKLAKDIHQSLLLMMGSNALHYDAEVWE